MYLSSLRFVLSRSCVLELSRSYFRAFEKSCLGKPSYLERKTELRERQAKFARQCESSHKRSSDVQFDAVRTRCIAIVGQHRVQYEGSYEDKIIKYEGIPISHGADVCAVLFPHVLCAG